MVVVAALVWPTTEAGPGAAALGDQRETVKPVELPPPIMEELVAAAHMVHQQQLAVRLLATLEPLAARV
jgi:hypothetical protein